MVNPYLVGAPAAGAGALLVVKSIFKNKENNVKKGEKEQRRGTVTDDEASFACERVCASDRLLKRMGGLAKVINQCAQNSSLSLSLARAARGENLLPFSSSVFFRALYRRMERDHRMECGRSFDAIPRLNENESESNERACRSVSPIFESFGFSTKTSEQTNKNKTLSLSLTFLFSLPLSRSRCTT